MIAMEKFVPLNKMSKKKQREFHRLHRKDWGGLSPVTRNTKNPKAYDRAAEKRREAAQKCGSDHFYCFLRSTQTTTISPFLL